MKVPNCVRAYLLLLTAFFLTHADVTKTYRFETPKITADSAIGLANCTYTFETGKPALPIKPVMLLLPTGEKAVSYTVTYGNERREVISVPIRPIAPGQILSAKKPTPRANEYRSAVYSENAFFPTIKRKASFSEMEKNGHRIFLTNLNPVRYNPVTRELLSYSSITIEIHTEKTTRSALYKFDPLVARNLRALVDNDEAIAALSPTPQTEEAYDYLVITSQSLVSSFDDFVAFNKTRSMKTKVVAIETIKSSGTGSDTQEKMRNFIRSEYEASNITYVLLGGDVETIPHRGFDAELYDYGTDHFHFHQIPADMYYGCLDGTWQNSGSNYYGEPGSEDNGFEVYVARITVENSTDVATFTTKVQRFVTAPIAEAVLNIGLAGEYLWSKPAAVYGDEHMDELVGTCNKNSYTTGGVPSTFRIDKSLYGRVAGSWEGSPSSMPNMIKSFEPTWVSHLGHCGTDYTMGFRNGNVTASNFPQDGIRSNYFFVYTQGCYPNAFDNCKIGSPLNNEAQSGSFGRDCVSEKLTLLETGCIAFLGNTRFGFGSTQGTDGSNQRFMRWFHHALFTEGISSLEMMNAFSKEKNATIWMDTNVQSGPYYGQCRWVCYQLNLLGDPALQMYSEEPTALTVTLPDTLTKAELLFETKPYARVALLNGSEDILFSTIADEEGQVSFNDESVIAYLKEHNTAPLTVNIYAENSLPFSQVLPTNIEITNTITKAAGTIQHGAVTQKGSQLLLTFSLPKAERVSFSLCTTQGKVVKNLSSVDATAGTQQLMFNLSDVAAGLYLLQIKSQQLTKCFKVSL